jgi:hypothetical protein
MFLINRPSPVSHNPRSEKSHEIFKLNSFCYISIKDEPCKSKTGLTQYHNCQQFGHVWVNCKQPPSACGVSGHFHKECSKNGNGDSTPARCICKLPERENPNPLTTEAAATRRRRCVGEKFEGSNTSRKACPSRRLVIVRKGIPHNHGYLPLLVSVEATGICISVGNDAVLLAAVYKSPDRPWNNTDIIELCFKSKTILASDLRAKHPYWSSSVSTY